MTNYPLQFNYTGLKMIISGGQCGADRGGIEAAHAYGIKTGGEAPRGWRTANGPSPELKQLGLHEGPSDSYANRTHTNIIQSDATVIIASNLESTGSKLTLKLCHKHDKPVLTLSPDEDVNTRADKLSKFIIRHFVTVLNVAGNRDFPRTEKHFEAAFSTIYQTLELLEAENLIVKE